MKKIIALLLAVLMTVGLFAGCAQPEASAPAAAPGADASAPAANEDKAPADDSAEPAGDDAAEDSFLLGVYLPLSGANATYSSELQNSIEMAKDYINANGGMNGVPIVTQYYDTTSSTEEAAKLTVKMVEVDQIDAAITTPMSSEILASVQTLMDAEIITFAQGTSGAVIKEEWPYLYRAAANNDFSTPQTFAILQELGYSNVAIFYSQDETAINQKNVFTACAEEAGVEVVAEETFDTGDTDFSAQITNIVSADPDVVFLSVVGDFTGIAIKQLRQFGYDGIILNKEDVANAQIEVAGAENCYYTIFANPYVTYNSVEDCDIEVMANYLQMYIDTYGEITTSDWPYRGWDSVMTLWEASKIAGSNDSAALQAAMSSVCYEGLGGTLDFSNSHEGYSSYNGFVYVDGQKVLASNWLTDGGYDAYLAATGREK